MRENQPRTTTEPKMSNAKRRGWTFVAVLSAVLTVAVVGCGTSGKAPSNTGGSSASTPASTTNTAASTGNANGAIVDGLFEEPGNLNPILGPNMTFSEIVDAALYRNLFMVDPTNKLIPQMASVVPTVANGGISKDGLTYDIHLNPNAKWSNGDPFTSKDVEVTYKLLTSSDVNAVSRLGWDDVQSLQIVSPTEFKVHLKKPDPGFLNDALANPMPGILPASVFGNMNPKDVNTASFNHDPTVTNGPYKFVSWVPGASITVTANPYWVGPKPKTQTIQFKIIPDQNTLLTNVKAHAINVWYFDPITDVPQLQAISGANVHLTPQPAFEMGLINQRNPILQDVRVRQALEMAIDRQAIVQQVYKGNAVLLGADQSKMSWTSNPNIQPYPYDPTQAKKLLAEAGWTMGSDGYLHKNGQILALTYSSTAGNSVREATERLIQYWFKQIGVKLTIKNAPANVFFGTMLPSGKGWDIAEYESLDSSNPTSATAQDFTPSGSSDYGNFNNPTVNRLMKQVQVTVDQTKAKQMMAQVEQILHDQLPALWYFAPDEVDTSVGISGYQPNPWSVDTWNVYDWQLNN
ncbi:peptide ABC transporter substrate-binding protein [Alicyclobacillus mengziensis]|uniref:Peptide ABC transporter substrate-binding protein n=1 Tax=Alicyclobacillus mengziensis TaxID=2931921 RepID=A0A9X7VYV9_9BACL|nr:peptide ABC transporter substrate-binding protein [Alicyclobacillus mengziensis]QSO47100.1 peptide ABC transporter substrate-binding protein [Alicyclobacillus mengziensis]